MSLAVLKREDSTLSGKRLRPLNLTDLEQLAERVLEGARAKSREILSEARKQAEEMRALAATEGHREGLARGLEEGVTRGHQEGLARAVDQFNNEQKQLVETLLTITRSIDDERNRLFSDAREDVVRLAIQIASRVTKRFAARDVQVATENLKEVLARIGQRHIVRITIHPDDAESMRCFASSLTDNLDRFKHMAIVESQEVERGGCLVDLPDGEIDATLHTQLDRITQSLVGGDSDE